ncbi:MAG: hypothetical protein QG636_101 [Patescibacteria group bacterium]|nr:hypothetical protein [Patescibacteria group bacterium]
MRYYLDFDRTLFDTDSFYEYLANRPGLERTRGLPAVELVEALNQMAMDSTLTFAPGELSQFLFQDAASFLREKENAVTIITYGNATFQEIKVKSALTSIPRMSVMYTNEVRKGIYLAPHTHLHAGAVLADDAVVELEILAEKCPSLTLYEMRRDGGEGDGRWPVIRSLAELP